MRLQRRPISGAGERRGRPALTVGPAARLPCFRFGTCLLAIERANLQRAGRASQPSFAAYRSAPHRLPSRDPRVAGRWVFAPQMLVAASEQGSRTTRSGSESNRPRERMTPEVIVASEWGLRSWH